MEALVALLSELNDLKRQATPFKQSLAADVFLCAWNGLLDGRSVHEVALEATSHAVAAARLGGIDAYALHKAGLTAGEIAAILQRGFDAVAAPIEPNLRAQLRERLARERHLSVEPPLPWLLHLAAQPRAGATRPGHARLMLLPAETHADHCAAVAIYSVLLAPRYGADFANPFLAALVHHVHNAWLPDAGFTGEEILGEELSRVIHALRNKAFTQLPRPLRTQAEQALAETAAADTPEARTFHAADVIDRVLQMRWYEQSAGFTLKAAMEDMKLVHAGPIQAFHRDVLREAGLW